MSQYALVTGAAKGIGRAIAEELAKRNYHLLLADIDGPALRKTALFLDRIYNNGVDVLEIDLSQEDAPQRLWQWSLPSHRSLTVVVNNAGFGLNAAFADLPLSEHLALIRLNIGAVVSLSHLFIPVLKMHSKAWLLNVGSTTAYQTVPYLNTYASSKAFILSFTRGLRQELRGSPLSVSCLSPGSTNTNFVHRAGMSARTQKLAERYNMEPAEVARIAITGLFKGKAEIVPGITNKVHAFLPKFFPKSFVERIAATIYGPKPSRRIAPPARNAVRKRQDENNPLLN